MRKWIGTVKTDEDVEHVALQQKSKEHGLCVKFSLASAQWMIMNGK